MSMYFVALSLLAIISGYLWYKTRVGNRYRLDILALISSGAAVMFLIDSLYSYLGGEGFVEFSVDSLILSIILSLTATIIWLIVLVIKRLQQL
ncbi:MAG: hypothetical protein QXL96_01155 [Ignisphaera sp.]